MDGTAALIERYFAAFNAGDAQGMLGCVTEDVRHDVNQGGTRLGRAAFKDFCAHMARSYREEVADLVVMTSADGMRAAAEYMVHGAYLATDAGLPEASGQRYSLPAGSFFEIRDGAIARVTTFYNLRDWIAQVSS